MKIALDWIADYLNRPLHPQEAEAALVNAGLPLESNVAVGPTYVLDVEVTSNRSDCLSHIGLARELAALLPGVEFRLPTFAARAMGPEVSTLTQVQVEDAAGCPYYSARVIQNVKVGPSPEWLVRRLESIGLRSVNNVVDITNFVLMETGQPLHAFDFDTLAERRIVVRRAREGEKIIAIDGRTYELQPSMLVIADGQRPACVAGVMGGKETEVSDATRNILLESARFDPVTIRAQGRALGLMSDSSYRFERGIDPAAAERASLRAAQLLHELCGGTVAQGVIVVGNAPAAAKRVEMRVERVKKILGYEMPVEAMVGILGRLGFSPVLDASGVPPLLRCEVPSHRLDIEREIDLIEEVARVYGYDKIPLYAQVTHGVQAESVREKGRRAILETLVACGFSEAITVTFVEETEAKRFAPAQATPIRAAKTVRGEDNVLRPSLLPSLLRVRRTNQNAGDARACVFEHASTFWQAERAADAPREERKLALVGNSVAEVRGVIEALAYKLNADAVVTVEPADFAWYAKGVAGRVMLAIGGKAAGVGSIGLFSAEVQKQYDLRHEAAGAEVSWEALLGAFEPVRRAKPLPRFPGVRRDLSIVVEDKVRWAAISGTVAGAKLPFMERVDFVGTFRNKQMGEGKKSLTLTLEFRDPAGTLRSEQVDEQMKAAVAALGGSVGAVVRG